MSRAGNILRRLFGLALRRPTNFSWIDENLAGSGRPSSLREVHWLTGQGIGSVLTLAEKPIPSAWIDSASVHYTYVKWLNHDPAPKEGLEKCLTFIRDSINSGKKLVVHCEGGSGRTGTVLAAYLVKIKGVAIEDAIREVRAKRPGSIEGKQEQYLREYFRVNTSAS